jgi:hypothetical protein
LLAADTDSDEELRLVGVSAFERCGSECGD